MVVTGNFYFSNNVFYTSTASQSYNNSALSGEESGEVTGDYLPVVKYFVTFKKHPTINSPMIKVILTTAISYGWLFLWKHSFPASFPEPAFPHFLSSFQGLFSPRFLSSFQELFFPHFLSFFQGPFFLHFFSFFQGLFFLHFLSSFLCWPPEIKMDIINSLPALVLTLYLIY